MEGQGTAVTPDTMFVAMFAVISCQVICVSASHYWAYIPDPPTLHPTPWGATSVHVFTNNSHRLGGDSNSFILHRSDSNFTFYGKLDPLPICFSTDTTQLPEGCLPINYQSMLTDSPNGNPKIRDLWVLN